MYLGKLLSRAFKSYAYFHFVQITHYSTTYVAWHVEHHSREHFTGQKYQFRQQHCCTKKKGLMTKGVHLPETLTRKGRCFLLAARFAMYMWSSTSIQRPSTMCALPRCTILHIFTITVSEQPNTQQPVVQALFLSEKPNVMVTGT